MKKFLSFFIFILFVALQIKHEIYAAPIGNYLELNGGYLSSPTTLSTSPSSVTIEAWIKPSSVTGVQKIISIGEKNANKLHYEVGINGGSLSLNYRFGVGSQTVITAGNIPSGVWSHIKTTISSSQTALFINGTTVFSTDGANNLLPLSDTISVGRSFTQSAFDNQIFKGAIDEVQILQDNTLTVVLHLDEARGQLTATDSSDNNIHAQLIGGDSKIHFFGTLPTPTPYTFFVLPTIRWIRPTLPSFRGSPSATPTPSNNDPTPTTTFTFPTISDPIRGIRPTQPSLHR